MTSQKEVNFDLPLLNGADVLNQDEAFESLLGLGHGLVCVMRSKANAIVKSLLAWLARWTWSLRISRLAAGKQESKYKYSHGNHDKPEF